MERPQDATKILRRRDPQTATVDERRQQGRGETVLSQIEDATYAILRKHEKKSA